MFSRNLLKVKELFGFRRFTCGFVAALATVSLALLPGGALRAQVPGDLTGTPTVIEDQVAQDVEQQVEDAVTDAVTDSTQEAVQDAVEEQIDDILLLGPGDSISQHIEDQVEAQVEDTVAETVQDTVEQVTQAAVEETIAAQVEDQITETVTDHVEVSVEENVEQTIEESITAATEDAVESNVAGQVEDSVQQSVAQSVEASVEDQAEAGVESAVEDAVAGTAEAQVADAVEGRLDGKIDAILDDLESDLEVDEERIHSNQWLVMAEPQVFEELAEEGYLFETVTELPALGMRLAEVAGPSSFDITEVRRGVLDVVGKDRAEVDLNHIYTAGTELVSSEQAVAPRAAMDLPENPLPQAAPPRIGMIDSLVDTSHPALAGAHIHSRSFVPADAQLPSFHGTAIASIIAANSAEYRGLEPDAEVYAAAVFEQDPERGEIASTVSLLRALDWLITCDVDVVNISLAGPPNRLLEAALKRATAHGMLILAAAGNGGPVAKPMYPAAYDTVVAVTAVDSARRVFRLANRGAYLDIAAPGVALLHARAGGGYVASSGTSFAVPFAATAAATLRRQHPGDDVMSELYRSAEDLGPPGRDDIYGYGLLRFSGS